MAWTFLAASEESATHSETTSDQSPIAKSTPIVKQSCSHEWPDCLLQPLPYGMTLKVSPSSTSSQESILFMVVSHARELVLLDMEKAWRTSEADYFSRSCAWPKKSSPDSYSLKTSQQLQEEEDIKLSKHLPPSGIHVDGSLRVVKRLDRPRIVKDGFVWPTPTASQASKPIREPSPSRKANEHGYDLQDKIGEIHPWLIGKKINPQFLEWMMMYPLGWTELEPWAMQFVSSKRVKHLKN